MNSKDSVHTLRHNLFRALTFVWESGRGWTIGSGALVLVQGMLPLGMLS